MQLLILILIIYAFYRFFKYGKIQYKENNRLKMLEDENARLREENSALLEKYYRLKFSRDADFDIKKE